MRRREVRDAPMKWGKLDSTATLNIQLSVNLISCVSGKRGAYVGFAGSPFAAEWVMHIILCPYLHIMPL